MKLKGFFSKEGEKTCHCFKRESQMTFGKAYFSTLTKQPKSLIIWRGRMCLRDK